MNYGYVRGGLQQVAIQNKDGNYVKASAETASAGLGKIVLDDQLRGADANPAGENSYPIVSLTWILAYPEYSKNDNVKDVIPLHVDSYSTTEGRLTWLCSPPRRTSSEG